VGASELPFKVEEEASPFMKMAEVIKFTSLGKTRIYELIKDKESGFPQPFHISVHAVRFSREAIYRWCAQKIQNTGTNQQTGECHAQ
jgi:predicted DNA-binding transcriptional regulator AlpA